MGNPSEFWQWFEANQVDYRLIPSGDTDLGLQLLADLNEQLYKYCENIFSGIGRISDNVIEMTITANGNKQYFKAVEELIKHAPKLEGWEFKALIQPAEKDFVLKLTNGLQVNTEDIYFNGITPEESGPVFGIRVYIKDYEVIKNELLEQIVSEIVQLMAGEKAFALDIDMIETAALPKDEPMIPIKKLSHYIQWYKSQVQKN